MYNKHMLEIKRVTPQDNLDEISTVINKSDWDSSNDLSTYTKEALLNYFNRNQDNIFLICYKHNELAGIASGNNLQKPYDNELWLYIDEIDVAVPHRRQGVGKALMKEFIAIATDHHCKEIWVGTEKDNKPAHAFYSSLAPHEIEEHFGYTFKL